MNLSDRLRQLRLENNYSQSEIADKLNISASAYGFYEQGKSIPNAVTLNILANLYNVTTDYILARSDNPNLTEKEEINIQLELKNMKQKLEEGTLQMNLDGEEIDEDIKQFILDNMEDTLTLAKIKAKEKFTPKKYRK